MARHLWASDADVKRRFPPKVLQSIEHSIAVSEACHGGQIRFAVEACLDIGPLWRGQTARERAIELFSLLHVWDTEHINGLLIYLLLADRAVEIVADRGIAAKVGGLVWREICRQMEAAFRQSNYQAGAIHGVQAVTRQLVRHFPADQRANELSDRPVVV